MQVLIIEEKVDDGIDKCVTNKAILVVEAAKVDCVVISISSVMTCVITSSALYSNLDF